MVGIFILTILLIAIATIMAIGIFDLVTNKSSICYSTKKLIISIVSFIVCIVISSFLFHYMRVTLEDHAIKNYINGGYEVIEKVIDGETVDTKYRVFSIDYD